MCNSEKKGVASLIHPFADLSHSKTHHVILIPHVEVQYLNGMVYHGPK